MKKKKKSQNSSPGKFPPITIDRRAARVHIHVCSRWIDDGSIRGSSRLFESRLSGNGTGLGISARNDGWRPTAIGRHCQGVLSTAGQIGRHG